MPSPDTQKSLIIRSAEPYNAEPALGELIQSFITPYALFYVRNHAPVPGVNAETYRLNVTGLVKQNLTLSMQELKEHFPQRKVTATLQCAGNRRDELMRVKEIAGETPWNAGAIGTAEWTGAALRDILAAAGVEPEARHIAFTGLDAVQREGKTFGFGGSIPVEKAMHPEVLLAYEMNGEVLSPLHGFPLRVVVPGYIGARSVKWLGEVRAQSEPSDNYFYQKAYQLFSPEASAETVDWKQGIKLGVMSVNAVICQPGDGEQITAPGGLVTARGFAISGGRRIERVELTRDEGQHWITARILQHAEESAWTWVIWEAELELPPGAYRLAVRAWDSAANTQPEQPKNVWNFKGYMNNSWHRVHFEVCA